MIKKNRLSNLLEKPYWFIIIGAIALLLGLFTINIGLLNDDYFHANLLREDSGPSKLPSWQNQNFITKIFSFLPGTSESIKESKDLGILPWWASENLKISFFRPLSALSIKIDYTLWPDNHKLKHLHSIALFILVGIIGTFFFRDFIGKGKISGGASLLFVLGSCFSIPVYWLANRNALLALIFALLTLILHNRWRREKKVTLCILSCLTAAFTLLSAESGIGLWPYLLAYALFMDQGKNRLKSILPYIIILVLWLGFYMAGGYGSEGTDYYISPFKNPLHFAQNFIIRYPILLLGVFSPLGGLGLVLSTEGLIIGGVIISIFIFLILLLLKPLWKKESPFLFMLMGLILSAVPAAITIPSPRNLLIASIGGAGLTALLANEFFKRKDQFPLFRKSLMNIFFFCLLIITPIITILIYPGNKKMIKAYIIDKERISSLPALQKDHITEVIIVNPLYTSIIAMDYSRDYYEGKKNNWKYRTLCNGLNGVSLKRVDKKTLEVTPNGGFCLPPKGKPYIGISNATKNIELLLYSTSNTYRKGYKIPLSGVTIEVTELTDDKRPLTASYEFTTTLEDDKRLWIYWTGSKYEEFKLPQTGETVRLEKL